MHLHCADYAIVGSDLRNVADLQRDLQQFAGLDLTLPTLFVSECVLVYMTPEASARVIEWAASAFSGPTVFLTYEQIHPNGPFGKYVAHV